MPLWLKGKQQKIKKPIGKIKLCAESVNGLYFVILPDIIEKWAILVVILYQYSPQALMSMSSSDSVVKALMNAEARRQLVINGTLRSMAARRIL
jgi:hypothetical protein